jgi:hypothetical protein
MLRCIFTENPLWCGWDLFPGWAQWSLIACAVLFVFGVVWRFKDIAQAVAGWPGVAAVLGVALTLLAVFWPKRRKHPAEKAGSGSAANPKVKPLEPATPKKKRPTIFDHLKR